MNTTELELTMRRGDYDPAIPEVRAAYGRARQEIPVGAV
jgi:hypothetical protein